MAFTLAWKELVSSFCSQEVTACFTLASVTNRLLARFFLRGPKGFKSPEATSGLQEGQASNFHIF
jgi:hypothetical protein